MELPGTVPFDISFLPYQKLDRVSEGVAAGQFCTEQVPRGNGAAEAAGQVTMGAGREMVGAGNGGAQVELLGRCSLKDRSGDSGVVRTITKKGRIWEFLKDKRGARRWSCWAGAA